MKSFIICFILVVSCFIANSATFVSIATGGWGVSTTWSVTVGTDTDRIPDADDNVTITSHSVSLPNAANICKSLTINAPGVLIGNARSLSLKGNFTNLGIVSGGIDVKFITAAVFSSATTFTSTGTIWVQGPITLTIAAGTVINKRGPVRFQVNNAKIINNGNVTLVNNGSSLGTIYYMGSGNTWTNATGSSLTLASNINLNAASLATASLICTASNNTVTYSGTTNSIFNTTYSNLNLISNTTKTLSNDLNILGNFSCSGASNRVFSNGHTINVGGNYTNNGLLVDFETSGDKIVFNGVGNTQNVGGTVNTRFWDLEINNTGGSVVFNTNQSIINDLIMEAGNCNANNRLTLVSDVNQTASIAPITNTAAVSFSGNLIVQNFMPSMPAQYYDMSCPVSNTNVMDWDNEMYISGIGPYDGIGGPAGVDGSSLNGSNTMNTYVEATNTFAAVTGSNTALAKGVGYSLLLADDASITFWLNKTVDSRGTPNFGDVALPGLTYNAGAGAGWHLVGNPYASHIDYALVTKERMEADIYYTDNGNYNLFPDPANIPPYQGFWVKTTASVLTHGITFTEACKVTGNHTTEFYRQKPKNNDIKLLLHSSAVNYSHEVAINFNETASVNYDEQFDASYRKFPEPIAPAIYMIDGNGVRNMIRNEISSALNEVTIPLGIFTPKAGMYQIDLSVINSSGYNRIWIENTKTGDKYEYPEPAIVEGDELGTNTNFVLRMSKKGNANIVVNESSVLVFATENNLNLKSISQDQILKEVNVFDVSGKLVLSQYNISLNTLTPVKVDLSELLSGIYIVNTIDEKGMVKNIKIIK